jgi:hypothetical protein
MPRNSAGTYAPGASSWNDATPGDVIDPVVWNALLDDLTTALNIGTTGATDNRLIRSDGTGGLTIQSSAATLDDSGNLTGVTISSALSTFVRAETGAVSRTAQDKIRESLSVLDFIPTALHADIVAGTNVTPLTTYVQAAMDAAVTAKKDLFCPGGTYLIDDPLDNNGVHIRGERGRTTFVMSGAGSMFTAFASDPTLASHTLASNAAPGDLSLSLTAGHGASFAAGNTAVLLSEANVSAVDPTNVAEFVTVRSVSSDTVNLRGPVKYTYATSDTAQLVAVTLLEGVGYSDFSIEMDDTVTPVAGGTYQAAHALEFRFCKAPLVRGVTISKGVRAAIELVGCLNARIYDYTCRDMGSANNDTDGSSTLGVGGYGYAISERALNVGLVATNLHIERCRHGYTSGADYTWGYGSPQGSVISNGVHIDSKEAGWDTHETGDGIIFLNLHTIGSRRTGIQIRAPRTKVFGCSVKDCFASGIWLVGAALDAADNCLVHGFTAVNTNFGTGDAYDGSTDWRELGAIRNQGFDNIFDGIYIENCGGPAIYENTTTRRGTYRNVRVIDPCQLATTNTDAILLRANGADTPYVENVFIRSTDAEVVDLVATENSAQIPRLFNVDGSGHTGQLFSGALSNRFIGSGTGAHHLNTGYRQNVTLASDAFSVAGLLGPVCQVLPESGTSDTLSSITGGEDGDTIILRGTTGNTITLAHGSGTDNLFLLTAANVNLVANTHIVFTRWGGVWFEDHRSFLTPDLSSLEGLSTTGLAARTATNTWATRSLTAPAAGLTIADNDAVAGDPTFALANDLAGLEGLASTGFAVRSATDTWLQRSIAVSGAGLSIANGSGVSGNPTISLADDVATIEGLSPSNDDILQRKAGAWANRTIAQLLTDLAAAGTTFQPLDSDLTSWAGVTRAAGFDTFAATPSSANLISLVTDETGSGALVFGTSPTLATPTITTSATVPLVIGGTAVSSGLTLRSTSGVGSSDAIVFQVGNNGATEGGRFFTGGQLGLGTNATISATGGVPKFMSVGLVPFCGFYFGADANPVIFSFCKSRNASIGAHTVLNNADTIADVRFEGSDGTNFIRAAAIRILVDGTPGTNDMPASMLLMTTPDGSATPVERLRCDPAGNVSIGTAAVGTTATDGFLYVPTCAGTPTGVPTAKTGRAALVYDSTNNLLYVNDGGGWVAANSP